MKGIKFKTVADHPMELDKSAEQFIRDVFTDRMKHQDLHLEVELRQVTLAETDTKVNSWVATYEATWGPQWPRRDGARPHITFVNRT